MKWTKSSLQPFDMCSFVGTHAALLDKGAGQSVARPAVLGQISTKVHMFDSRQLSPGRQRDHRPKTLVPTNALRIDADSPRRRSTKTYYQVWYGRVAGGVRDGQTAVMASLSRPSLDDHQRRQAQTVELLQTLIRNACVNDGTAESGQEQRNVDVLEQFLAVPGIELQRFRAAPGRDSLVARLRGADPDAPRLCLMGHTDVVPVDPNGWTRDPFGGELVTAAGGRDGPGFSEVWGRGAVDMLNLTASMAVAMREVSRSGTRPAGDLIYFAVADEESGSAYGARWMAEHHRDAIEAEYVLTENGGLHSGPASAPWIGINVAEKGVAWRRLRLRGSPGHGSMPFRSDNALVKAAAVVTRLAEYRPAPRMHELWRQRVETLGLDGELQASLMDPDRLDGVLAALPNAGAAAHLHACSHTTFSPNVSGAPVAMKTNVIPGVVELQVDIRTMPGEGTDEVDAHLRAALGEELYHQVEVEIIMNDPASTSRIDTPLWDVLQRAVAAPFPGARLTPQMVVGFTDARVYRQMGAVAYGAGLFSPNLDGGDFSRRFHGNDERIDVESLGLSTQLWLDVVAGLWD